MLVAFTVSNVSRAIRWNMILRPLGCKPRFINSFLTTFTGYFFNLLFPRLGEIVRPTLFARYEKLPVEKVMGTIVVDRILDVVSIFIVTGFALLVEYDQIWAFLQENVFNKEDQATDEGGIPWKTIFLALIAVGGGLLFLLRKRLANSALFNRFKTALVGFSEGLRSVGKLQNPAAFIFHSIVIWVMYFLMTWFCFFAYEPTSNMPAMAAFLVFVFGAWGIVIPSPGGMGSYHALAMLALAIYGVNNIDSFSFANISFFTIQFGANILIGVLALILLPIINKNYHPVIDTND